MLKTTPFWIRCTIWLAVALLLIFGGTRLYYAATDDFHLGNIIQQHPYQEEWCVPALPEEQHRDLLALLNQEFHYLGKGAQSYALESADGQYVLKLFKSKHIRSSWLLNFLPNIPYVSAYKKINRKKKQRRLRSIFNGYKLAYEIHREEAGLVYVHLNPTQGVFPTVTLADKIGWRHQLPLDSVAFIVQKKVTKTRDLLKKLIAEGKTDEAKHRIGQVFDLYVAEYAKGIYDRDHGVLHNTGFAGEIPIHLDVGKLSQNGTMQQQAVFREDLKWVVEKFDTWLGKYYPKHYPELADYMEGHLSDILGETIVLTDYVPCDA